MKQNVNAREAPDSRQLGARGPSFLFIGPPRSGSSWFAEILREHPSIFIPRNKGTFFFSKFHSMGLAWYEGFFPRTAGGAVGEICEDYLASPEALARIKAYRPDIRLICCLRNPYDRAISAWRFFARNGLDQPTLAAQAERNPDLFEHGYYATHLLSLQSLFSEEQILTFYFEDLLRSPGAVARRVYEFLGVDPEFVPPSLHVRINARARPRSRLLARLVHDIHIRSWGASRHLSNAVGRIKRFPVLHRLVTAALYDENSQPGDWRELLPEFPPAIVERYEQEIAALEQISGRDLSQWHIDRAARQVGARAISPELRQPAEDYTGKLQASPGSDL